MLCISSFSNLYYSNRVQISSPFFLSRFLLGLNKAPCKNDFSPLTRKEISDISPLSYILVAAKEVLWSADSVWKCNQFNLRLSPLN